MRARTHLIRNVSSAVAGVVVLVVAATIVEGGALATVVALLAVGVAVVIIPFVVIHYDEHPELLRRSRPH